MARVRATPIGLLLLVLFLTWPVAAHEGHDHGAPAVPVDTRMAPRAEASSDAFEIVVVARSKALEVSVDRFGSNEPVADAQLEIDTPRGIMKPRNVGGGLYLVDAPFADAPGKYDLAITITTSDATDILAATLQIPEDAAAVRSALAASASGGSFVGPFGFVVAVSVAFAAGLFGSRFMHRRNLGAVLLLVAGAALSAPDGGAQSADASLAQPTAAPVVRDIAMRMGDGGVFVPKSTQRLLGIRTALTREEEINRGVELPGRLVPDVNATGLVQATIGGRLFPPEGGFKPLGTVVVAGDVLAYVRPPLPSADATVQAQQARELDQQISITTRKVERYQSLAPSGAMARNQLEDAELELKGLRERRANLDRVNRDPEPLRAPVSGVISAANAVAGQMAEPTSVIFQIVDPAKLWVEALAFDADALTQDATAVLPGGRSVALAYLGSGLAERNQAVLLQFAATGDVQGLRAGQLVTVFAKTSDMRKGIAVPRSAVVRGSNGQALVYEHASAERFVPHDVRVVGLDGDRVLIVAGFEAGKRVVTQGAELLDQIR